MKNEIIANIITISPVPRKLGRKEIKHFIRIQKRSAAFTAVQEAYRA